MKQCFKYVILISLCLTLAPKPAEAQLLSFVTNFLSGKVRAFMGGQQQPMLDQLENDLTTAHQQDQAASALTDSAITSIESTFVDADDFTDRKMLIEKLALSATDQLQLDSAACQMDTRAAVERANAVSLPPKELSKAYQRRLVEFGDNKVPPPNPDKPNDKPEKPTVAASEQKKAETAKRFCDKANTNQGQNLCPDNVRLPNEHVDVAKLLATNTINVADQDVMDAHELMMINLCGITPVEVIKNEALKASGGLEQQQENRQYLARKNMCGTMFIDAVIDRTPGVASLPGAAAGARNPVTELRLSMGAENVSEQPSAREIRRATVERILDPKYTVELQGNNETTLARNEMYLKAESLKLTMKILEKQEKISTLYAIQAASVLGSTDNSRDRDSKNATITGGE